MKIIIDDVTFEGQTVIALKGDKAMFYDMVGSLVTIVFEIVSYKNDFDKWFGRKLFDKSKQKIWQKK